MTSITVALAALGLVATMTPAVAADIAGSGDYPSIGRYAGSEIIQYEVEGIAAARLTSDGVGYLAPAANNTSDAGRALNRRVELVRDK